MKNKKILITMLSILFFAWFIGMLLPMIPSSSAALNQTVLTKVNVSNTEPRVFNVTITPGTVTLSPGGTTNVTCNGTVWDFNGVPTDMVSVNATLYYEPVGVNGPTRNNTRYFTSCTNVTYLSATMSVYSCEFNVWYFARNGTWYCNLTAIDRGNINNSNISSTVISPLIALNVSDVIDYGIVPVLNTSDDREANITNFGNIPINISVRGWGGQNESLYANLSMICEYGNISVEYERFNTTPNTPWANMWNLTGTNQMVSGLIVNNVNDTYKPINKTYWKIQIPSGVGGLCNGTILFTASNTA